ncbi:MAG TPA: tetratricopeptide repeat protein [Gemmatimonadales bacterium]|nr:tetratricopeptide repeat protein [Gemmatimonadales bacterium]
MYRFSLAEGFEPSPTRRAVGITLVVLAMGAAAFAVGCGHQSTTDTTTASLPTSTKATPAGPAVPVTPPGPTPPTVSHYKLAVTAWRGGDRDGAVTEFRAAIAEDSSKLPPRLNLSRVLIEQGKAKDAIGEIEQVIALDSTSGSAYRLLGRAHDFLGQTDSAVADYQHAIVLNDQDGWSINNLGLVQIERGEYDEALKTLSRAVELSNSATFRNSLGVALEKTGHYTAAVEAYKSALSADSGYTRAQTNLTRVSSLTEAPGTPAVDLAGQALEFMKEVDSWKTPKN